MNYEKIVTLYDTAEHAEAARRNMEAAGFSPSEMSLVTSKTLGADDQMIGEPGVWRRLFGRDIAQHEATVYGRAVERGGVVLTVRVPETDAAKALGILNAHHVVDVRERAIQQGLISAASAPTKPATVPITAAAIKTAVAGSLDRTEVLRLAEEDLAVGKRLIQEGTTRIRRFITEKPVEAHVTLHEEHIKVVRRAVTDSSSLQDIDWTDKTVEITDTVEQPVVTKSAHVAEEVVIRKEASDHVETVRDTVRRQNIVIDELGPDGKAKTPPKVA